MAAVSRSGRQPQALQLCPLCQLAYGARLIPMSIVEIICRLWFLFLALFRFKPEKQMSKTVLPLSSNGRIRVVGKPELFFLPHQSEPTQRRAGRLAGSHHQKVPHPSSYPRSKPQDLPSDGLPNKGHPHSQGFSAYSLIQPDRPPPRPPRPPVASASEDEFSTPIIPDVRLPSVIVTPCTPSTKASRTYICTSELDELNWDENGESSGSDANSCIASVDSNPFLSESSLQKEFNLRPLRSGTPNYHHRARSLTGTGWGLQHQRFSRSEHFSFLPRGAKIGMLTNPVKKSDPSLPIGASMAPSANATSFTRFRPNVIWESTSQAIADQRIRSYMTISSKKSIDQTLTLDVTSVSTRHSEDPKTGATASCGAQPAVLAYPNTTVMDQSTAPSNLTPSVHGRAPLGLVPYTEVFDLDVYFDFDSSLSTESTLKSYMNASCSTIDSNDPFLIPTTPSANRSSPAIVISAPQLPRRVSNISDTSVSSTSIYTYSLSNTSTDMDESASAPTNPGFIRITDNGRKSKIAFDHEVKRYRDHYRPPGYSRSPAFVIESPTTSRKFTAKKKSDRADKENEMVASTTSKGANTFKTKIANPLNPSSPCQVHEAQLSDTGTRRAPTLLVQKFQPFRNHVNYTPDSSTTAASISPAGKNIATRHRLGSIAISQRRRM